MLFFCLVAFAVCFSKGAWSVLHVDSDSCDSGVQIATRFSPDCVQMETESQTKEWSFIYGCDNKGNVTFQYFTERACSAGGTLIGDVHVAQVGVCEKNEKGSEIWKVLQDYTPDYKFMDFYIPFNITNKDIGSIGNPMIAIMKYPQNEHCLKIPGSKFHYKTSCDRSIQQGEIIAYRSGACLIPEKKIKLVFQSVINFAQFYESPKSDIT